MKLTFALLAGILLAQAQSFEDLARRAEAAVDSDPAQAASLFKEALHQRPSWPEGWFYLGGALYRLDRYAEASEGFNFACSLPTEKETALIKASLSR